MAPSRTAMTADAAREALAVIAKSKKALVDRWGVTLRPIYGWEQNGVPNPTATAVAYGATRAEMSDPEARLQALAEAAGAERLLEAARQIVSSGKALPITLGHEMSGDTLVRAIGLLGLDRDSFADSVNATRRTVERWIAGHVQMDRAVIWMIRAQLADRAIELDFGDPVVAAVADYMHDAAMASPNNTPERVLKRIEELAAAEAAPAP